MGAPDRQERGQSSVEYALVLLAFVSMLVALAALWHAARDGSLGQLAARCASHALGQGWLAALQDITAF